MKKLFLFLCLTISLVSFSQNDEFYYKDYDWKSKPEAYVLSAEELKLDQVTLLEKKYFHFLNKDEKMVKYNLEHKIIRLNSDKAIERNNKYYVSNYGSIEIITQKARVIKPNGTIIELSTKDIKTATDEQGNPQYQYFAFEGIEIGSTIEYFHVISFPTTFTGVPVIVQNANLKKQVEHEIICPKHLEFKIKSINGLPDFVKDTVTSEFTRYTMKATNIEAAEEEESASYDAMVQKYYYMLFRNKYSGKSNFYNYQDVTKIIYGNIFTPLTSKESKKLNKFIKGSGTFDKSSTIEKVRCLENYIKSTIAVQEDGFENCLDVATILDKKITIEDGALKLYINCFKELKIKFEVVYTCDRAEDKFIADFQGYNFLKKPLIYINELDQYMSPDIFTKIGFPSTELIFQDGLFIKEIQVGEVTSSIGTIKRINGPKMENSVDEMNLHVKLNDDLTATLVDIERKTTGYKAIYQSYMKLIDEESEKKMKEEYINYIDNDAKPETMSFQNDSAKLYGAKPFIGKGTLKSSNFLENAGDKTLFKIGALIGPQSNLYNSKVRKFPVENPYLRKYDRTITFEIPEGYQIKNDKDIIISVKPELDNHGIGFESSYEIKGNILTVKIIEWYNTILIGVPDYKAYENVVNAAADFNKLVLVLEKKK